MLRPAVEARMGPDSIIVVASDSRTLDGLTRALAQGGVPVVSAHGFGEAESQLGRSPCSVMVADVDALSADGLRRIRQLRAEFPAVSIVALVSFATPEIHAAEIDGTLLAVLEKPVELGRLEACVRQGLARSTRP